MLNVVCHTDMSCEEVGLMKFKIKHKQIIILVLLLITLVQGCGSTTSSDNCTAPAGSTITITPSSQSISVGSGLVFPTGLNWTVTVEYPDKTPMPKACITVSGAFAIPNGYGLYQFQFYPKDVSPNVPVPSGFSAQADDFGQYTFSTLLTAPSGTWTDTIYVQSGANSGNATISITQ